MSAPVRGFDAAQAAYDNEVPDYLDDDGVDEDLCDYCGDQAVCPECVGT